MRRPLKAAKPTVAATGFGVPRLPLASAGTGAILLNYSGGPVMLGQTHIYYIYYGNWSVDPNAAEILNNFANNLAGSGYYNILTQYYSGNTPSGACQGL